MDIDRTTPADLIRAAEIEEAYWLKVVRCAGMSDAGLAAWHKYEDCKAAALRAMAVQTQEIE